MSTANEVNFLSNEKGTYIVALFIGKRNYVTHKRISLFNSSGKLRKSGGGLSYSKDKLQTWEEHSGSRRIRCCVDQVFDFKEICEKNSDAWN